MQLVPPQDDEELAAAGELLDELSRRFRFDLGSYRRESVFRSIQRRMFWLGVEGFDDYRRRLAADEREFRCLREAILVRWTSFLRNSRAWISLVGQVQRALIEKPQSEPLRVWSAGCSTGEEAYTLAILLAEVMGVDAFRQRVKIFATDVSAAAIGVARAGWYPTHRLEQLPSHLRTKYLRVEGDGARVTSELRRKIVFARHDLLKDAPLGGLDIIACRNTLVHFTQAAKERVLAALYLALRPDGFLFAGIADYPDLSEFFQQDEDSYAIYRPLPGCRRRAFALTARLWKAVYRGFPTQSTAWIDRQCDQLFPVPDVA